MKLTGDDRRHLSFLLIILYWREKNRFMKFVLIEKKVQRNKKQLPINKINCCRNSKKNQRFRLINSKFAGVRENKFFSYTNFKVKGDDSLIKRKLFIYCLDPLELTS